MTIADNNGKWIQVYLSVYFDKEMPESHIKEIGQDMALIINNTKAVFSKENYFIGCFNEYLGKSILTLGNSTTLPLVCYDGKKYSFLYDLSNKRDQWHIVLYPLENQSKKPDFYSIEEFHYDMFILGHSSDYITEKYQLQLQTLQGSCNTEIIQNTPYLTHFTRLIVFRYKVEDRFNFQKENPELDKMILGGNKQTFSDLLDQIFTKEPKSNWSMLVKEIIK